MFNLGLYTGKVDVHSAARVKVMLLNHTFCPKVLFVKIEGQPRLRLKGGRHALSSGLTEERVLMGPPDTQHFSNHSCNLSFVVNHRRSEICPVTEVVRF